MRSLYSSKIVPVLVILSCFFMQDLAAQYSRGSYNFQDFQAKPYYYGITIGYNQSKYRLNHSKTFILNDSISIAEAQAGPGFSVAAIINLKIGRYFDFRVLPGFSISERTLRYKKPGLDEPFQSITIEPVIVDAPFLLRFKSDPYKDKRAFVITGVKYSYDVQSNSRIRREFEDSVVKISPHDFQIEVGAGVQFFLPYFILSPEIKFSQGIGNTLIYNNKLEASNVLEKVFTRILTFSLHFEG